MVGKASQREIAILAIIQISNLETGPDTDQNLEISGLSGRVHSAVNTAEGK